MKHALDSLWFDMLSQPWFVATPRGAQLKDSEWLKKTYALITLAKFHENFRSRCQHLLSIINQCCHREDDAGNMILLTSEVTSCQHKTQVSVALLTHTHTHTRPCVYVWDVRYELFISYMPISSKHLISNSDINRYQYSRAVVPWWLRTWSVASSLRWWV